VSVLNPVSQIVTTRNVSDIANVPWGGIISLGWDQLVEAEKEGLNKNPVRWRLKRPNEEKFRSGGWRRV